MVSFAIFGLLVLSAFYLFGTETEKTTLETARDEIVNSLKIAQQNSIAAYKGYGYSIEFDKLNNQYIFQPENEKILLDSRIEIESVNPSTITFQKLTGKLNDDDSLELILVSKRFKTTIQVDSEGIITVTTPEKRQ